MLNKTEQAKLDFKLWAATTDVKELMDKLSLLDAEDLELFQDGLLELEAQLQRISIAEGDDSVSYI